MMRPAPDGFFCLLFFNSGLNPTFYVLRREWRSHIRVISVNELYSTVLQNQQVLL
jgi:hypothetical protein